MSNIDPKTICRDFYESYNNKNIKKQFDDFIAEDLLNHTMGGTLDRQKWLDFDTAFTNAVPDLFLTVKEQFGDGNRVVTHWVSEGVHTADFMGMPASGNPIRLEGISIDGIENEKIKEHFALADFTQFMQQFVKK